MKLAIGILVFLWFLCGLIGAWRLDDRSWKTIARGPFSLAKGFNDNPVSYPGPN